MRWQTLIWRWNLTMYNVITYLVSTYSSNRVKLLCIYTEWNIHTPDVIKKHFVFISAFPSQHVGHYFKLIIHHHSLIFLQLVETAKPPLQFQKVDKNRIELNCVSYICNDENASLVWQKLLTQGSLNFFPELSIASHSLLQWIEFTQMWTLSFCQTTVSRPRMNFLTLLFCSYVHEKFVLFKASLYDL